MDIVLVEVGTSDWVFDSDIVTAVMVRLPIDRSWGCWMILLEIGFMKLNAGRCNTFFKDDLVLVAVMVNDNTAL